MAEIAAQAEQQDRSGLWRQRREGGAQIKLECRIGLAGTFLHLRIIRVASSPPQPTALAFAVFSPGDTEQPGTKGSLRVATRHPFPDKDESFLRQVVRLAIAAGEPPQKGAQRLLMQAHKVAKILRGAGLGAAHPGRFAVRLGHGASIRSCFRRASIATRLPTDRPAMTMATKISMGLRPCISWNGIQDSMTKPTASAPNRKTGTQP